MYKFLFLVFILGFSVELSGQNYWLDVTRRTPLKTDRRVQAQKYRAFRLSMDGLREAIAPTSGKAADGKPVTWVISAPMPTGEILRFRLQETPVMASELQMQYPEIRCYTGYGIDDPGAKIKVDLTPQGFHGMVISGKHNGAFIDPYIPGETELYIAYYKHDLQNDQIFKCEVEDEELPGLDQKAGTAIPQGDCSLRTYRLALACTGEYSTFHGGTKASVLAAMNTTVNRVNGVYERDLSVTMQLIAKNDTLIFLNGATDPYTNGDEPAMIDENVTVCTNRIGLANFDIGHVFGTGGGGLAGLSVVCTNSKARGVTTLNSPIGDAFDIDYVAHEIGHQFSGRHTQNNDCNRDPNASAEPGSGSTIMGYAGICAPNVQNNSNDYFHAINLQSMYNFITNGSGKNCPVKSNTGNTPPVVENVLNYTIPKSTPFALTAVGSDADNDPITYCWEQMNLEVATMPPVSTNTGGPMFRTFNPTSSPTRYFPRLQDLVANINSTWEELPGVARIMNFRVTVRDNHPGGGCTAYDDVVLNVDGNSGPFNVTNPNTALTWTSGETRTVTWDVANTNIAPINASQVRITLSIDGGLTYPEVLANAVPNNGSAAITVPNTPSVNCRVRVEAVGNVFFDISNADFTIVQPVVPTFFIEAPETGGVCAGDTLSFEVNTTSFMGFNTPINITIAGLPLGANFTVTPSPVTPGETATVKISGFTTGQAGNYNFTVQGTAGAIIREKIIAVAVYPGSSAVVTGLVPANGTSGTAISPVLQWNVVANVEFYTLQVSTSPVFTTLLADTNLIAGSTSFQILGLTPGAVYYWRIRGENACGISSWSTAAFQTSFGTCNNVFNSTNVPVSIPINSAGSVSSTISVNANKPIISVSVSMTASHTWLGDLTARLVSPANDTVLLFDRPGDPAEDFGCSENDINVTFDDAAALSADSLENMCRIVSPSISGTFKPVELLNIYAGANALGTWRLLLTDAISGDGGSLTSWRLSFCLGEPLTLGDMINNLPLNAPQAQTTVIPQSNLLLSLAGTAAQGIYTVLSLPQHGSLLRNGVVLKIGDQFSQADINAGLISYQHDGGDDISDSFNFSTFDQANSAWITEETFFINIIQNSLTASAIITKPILCNGEKGTLEVVADGLAGPFTFSLNGGPAEDSNIFEGLAPGMYTVVVTGNFGFTATATATLDEPPALLISGMVNTSDISLTATGGTPPLEYSLNGGAFQSSSTFSGLPNGQYIPVVRDANGCTVQGQALTVAVNTLAGSLQASDEVLCHDAATGSVTANVSGGKLPYEYSLNGGPFQSDATFTALQPGTYTVTVRDAEGFLRELGPVTLSNPPALVITASVVLDTITASGSGGTGALEFSINGIDFQSSGLFTGLANDKYKVVLRDANGCTTESALLTVGVNTLVATGDVLMQVSCHDGTTGIITASVSGGTLPYEYSINGGPFQASPTFSGLTPGTYTITVRDAEGFERLIGPLVLNNPPALSVSAGVNINTITATSQGGTGLVAYSLNGGMYQPSGVFNGLTNGTYTIVVRDENGCTATTTAIVNIPALVIVGVDVETLLCASDSEITITVQMTGGVAPYEYRVNGGDWQSSNEIVLSPPPSFAIIDVRDALGTIVNKNVPITLPLPMFVSVTVGGNDVEVVFVTGGSFPFDYQFNTPGGSDVDLPPGAYSVLVTDANGCTATQTFEITYIPVELGLNYLVEPSCTSMLAEVELEPIQGLAPYQYSVDGGTLQSSPTFTGLTVGLHTFRVIDAEMSEATLEINIEPVELPELSVLVSADSIIAVPSGGTPPYQFRLDTGAFGGDSIFTSVPNGNHTVIIRDAKGCLASTVVLVNSVIDPIQTWGLVVMPNPSTGLFQISLRESPTDIYAVVFDLAGRRVLEPGSAATSGGFELDLSSLPQGTYILQLISQNQFGAVRLQVIR